MRFAVIILLLIGTLSMAENKRVYTTYALEDKEWVESEQPIPAYPDLNSDQWLSYYVNETYKNTPMVLLDSIIIAPDASARYILNIKSPKGADNLTIEGIRCTDRLNKTYAIGDTLDRRWIVLQKSEWQSIRPLDTVRQRLREMLCFKGMPLNKTEAINRLKQEAHK